MSAPMIVGAYAALPAGRVEQEEFYTALHGELGVRGLEIPYKDALDDDVPWLADQVRGRFTESVVTAIPGTMMRVAQDSRFGLASGDAEGRVAALAFVRQIRADIDRLNDEAGEQVVAALQLHSAPTAGAQLSAFEHSLEELLGDTGASGPGAPALVIEHCDRFHPDFVGEKRFLSLEEEAELAQKLGLGVTVNWGRSALEAHDAVLPARQVGALVEAGALAGVMFSGAGPDANQYGGPWADAHLPHQADEPTSLMGDAEIRACLEAARGQQTYQGAKIQVPAGASVPERLAMLGRILGLMAS